MDLNSLPDDKLELLYRYKQGKLDLNSLPDDDLQLLYQYKQSGGGKAEEKSYMSRVGDAADAIASTGARMIGSIPQGLSAISAVGQSLVTGDRLPTMEDTAHLNPMTKVDQMFPPNQQTKEFQEIVGEGMDKFGQSMGRLARIPGQLMGMDLTEQEQRAFLSRVKDPEERARIERDFAKTETGAEFLGNFIPLGPAGKVKGATAKPSSTLKPSASKLDAVRAEVGGDKEVPLKDQKANISYAEFEENLRKMHEKVGTDPFAQPLGLEFPQPQGLIKKTDPSTYAAEREAAMLADIQRQLSEEGQLPTERTGQEASPLPSISPEFLSEPGVGNLGTPARPEVPAPNHVSPLEVPPGPIQRTFVPETGRGMQIRPSEVTPPGAIAQRNEFLNQNQGAVDPGFGFEPKRPAPTTFAGNVEAARAAREAQAGTIDFPGRVEHLTSDPMAQQLLRELDQRKSELPRMEAEKAKGGARAAEIAAAQRQTEARIAELEAQLRDNGWTGEPMTGKEGFFGFGKETLAPIVKSGTRDTTLSPNAGKAFDPNRNSIGRMKPAGERVRLPGGNKQRGTISTDLLGSGAVVRLLEKIGSLGVLEKFKGTFDSASLKAAIREMRDPKSRETLVWMSPSDFLKIAAKRNSDMMVSTDSANRRQSIREGLKSRAGLTQLPFISLVSNGPQNGVHQVIQHNGRHRMDVFQSMGVDKVPVILKSDLIRWGEDPERPLAIQGQKEGRFYGESERIAMPPLITESYGGAKSLTIGPAAQRGSVEGMGNSLLLKAWDRLNGKKTEASTFEKKASVEAATKRLPGVSSVYDGISRQGTNVPEVLAKNADFNKDLTKSEGIAGTTVTSGANIMAKATKNPFIRSVYEMWDGGTKAALRLIDEHVIPAEKLIKGLGEQSRIDVAALLREFEGVGTVSSDTLRRAGYSLDEIRAYEAHRKMMDAALARINEDRVAAGKKPLTAREGFATSTFRGAYKTVIRDEHNKPVYVVAAHTKMGHESLLKAFKERFGTQFKFDSLDPKIFESFKNKEKQADFFYDQFMRDLASDDPRAQAIQSAFEDWKRNHAEYDMGVNQHLKTKSEVAVGGAEGLRFEKNALENANAYLEAQLRYAENSMIWAEHQTAFRKTGELMAGIDRLPNTQAYLDAYRQNAIGMRSNWIGDISRAARLDSYYATKASSWIKAGLNSLLLGGPLNLAFIGTQLLQTINVIPEIVSIKGRLGQSQIKALAYDVPKAFVGVVTDLRKLTIKGDNPALRWAIDNHVIKAARFEDVGDINVPMPVKAASMVWNGPVKAADLGGRGIAYLAFVDALKKHAKGEELYQMAADAVERSMTDYRDFESPMIGGSGGTIGKGFMFLHKYPANWVNQLVSFGKQKEFVPFLALLGTSFFTAGLTGMIGVGMYDRIADAMGWPSIKEMLFKAGAPTWVTMGPLSAWSGIDTQAKTSMADLFPDTIGDAVLPGSGFVGNIAKDVMDPTVPWSGVAQTALPASMKGLSEKLFFEQPSLDPNKPHIRETINPKNRDAVYERDQTPKYIFGKANESDLRVLSARSTKESEWKQKEYVISKQRAREFKQAEGLVNKYKEAIQRAEGNPFALRRANEDLIRAWTAKGLNMSDIEQKLTNANKEAFLPQDVREMLKAQSNPENYMKGQAIRHGAPN